MALVAAAINQFGQRKRDVALKDRPNWPRPVVGGRKDGTGGDPVHNAQYVKASIRLDGNMSNKHCNASARWQQRCTLMSRCLHAPLVPFSCPSCCLKLWKNQFAWFRLNPHCQSERLPTANMELRDWTAEVHLHCCDGVVVGNKLQSELASGNNNNNDDNDTTTNNNSNNHNNHHTELYPGAWYLGAWLAGRTPLLTRIAISCYDLSVCCKEGKLLWLHVLELHLHSLRS